MPMLVRTSYKWRQSYGQFNDKVDPQVVGERIESLRAELGDGITPKQLVDDARPECSPTHDLFEWDNSAAAERFREHQARGVLNSLRITSTREEPTVANVSVRAHNGNRAYFPTEIVIKDPDLLEQALSEVRHFLAGFRLRYAGLQGKDTLLDQIFELTGEHHA